MTFSIGSDHAGFELKQHLIVYLTKKNYSIVDRGTLSLDSVDYPDFAHKVAIDVVEKKSDLGILVCGSGNGVAITANKHKGIRAALCWNSEIAALAKQHNNANIICIPARFISKENAFDMVDTFIEKEFEGGRHQKRVDKIDL